MTMNNNLDRVPSGISGLDELIGGGFPRGSLIVLAGNPGTGKTMFSAISIYNSIVNHGEKGVYVSFAESKESFFSNMLSIGLDFKSLEDKRMFYFLDMVTAKEEAAPAMVKTILDEVDRVGAKRLVIDSFSALAQAFKERHEVRVVLHTIMNRITRLLGCTTILIVEVPYGEERIGLGVEEFVADGIIMLRKKRLDGRLLRDLEILKMRGTPIPETQAVFTLKNGFKVFEQYKPKTIEKSRRFEPQPDSEKYFSTGSPDLDEMLGGGYPRGATVLIEIGEQISVHQYHLVTAITVCNFITQGRGAVIIPSRGVGTDLIMERAQEHGLTMDEINRLLRVCVKEHPSFEAKPYLIVLNGSNASEYVEKCFNIEQKLMESTHNPVLRVLGIDTLVDVYGFRDSLIALRACIAKTREVRGLCIMLLKPGYPRLAKMLGATADVYLKITREHGTVLVYGVKPRTNLYALEIDTSRGYPMPKLTPIV